MVKYYCFLSWTTALSLLELKSTALSNIPPCQTYLNNNVWHTFHPGHVCIWKQKNILILKLSNVAWRIFVSSPSRARGGKPLSFLHKLYISFDFSRRETFLAVAPVNGGGSNKVLGANEQSPDKVCFPAPNHAYNGFIQKWRFSHGKS